jgi:hypothetical protein
MFQNPLHVQLAQEEIFLIFFFFFYWRYNPLWILAFSMILIFLILLLQNQEYVTAFLQLLEL